jgi:spoIIIJ-associated protein
MSASLEFKARNVEEAVEIASQELKMPKKALEYEILSYGSSGIFGLSGARKAKIRVKLTEDAQLGELKADETEPSPDSADARPTASASGDCDSSGDDPAAAQNLEIRNRYSFPNDPEETGRLVLQKIVEYIAADAEISVEKDSEGLFFKVNGKNPGILIGKRGQTLNAIQSIVDKVVNKNNQKRIRVRVDIEGYLDTRRENLENMAVRLAEKSRRIGKPISLRQMNAYERRIVHLALQDFADVQTRSRGEGPMRKLVISPKKKKSSEN